MALRSRFFEKLKFLSGLSRLLMVAGVGGIIATIITGRQIILTWSAVSVGLGLAVGFFREAFRSRVRLGDQPKNGEKGSENDL